MHMSLFQSSPSFAVIAGRAGRDQVAPRMITSEAAGNDVINGQLGSRISTILAGVIIPSQDFSLVEFHLDARPFDHAF